MNVVIVNTVALNGGDAAILHSLIDTLRRAFDCPLHFVVLDDYGEVAGRFHDASQFSAPMRGIFGQRPDGRLSRVALRIARCLDLDGMDLAVRLRRLRGLASSLLTEDQKGLVDVLSSADLVVSTGGTYLVEQYDYRDRLRLLDLVLRLRRPLVLFTQTAGPFLDPEVRETMRRIVEGCALVLLRDEQSRLHIADLKPAVANVTVASDPVFQFADTGAIECAKTHQYSPEQIKHVGISVRWWGAFEGDAQAGNLRVQQALRALVIYIVTKLHASVTFVSTCQGVPEYWTDDSMFASEICDGLPEAVASHVCVDSSYHSPSELHSLLKTFDVYVAMRMHAGILALCAGVPVFPIAYEFKTQELYRQLGYVGPLPDVKDLTADRLVDSFQRYVSRMSDTVPPIFEMVMRQHDGAMRVAALLRMTLTHLGYEHHRGSRSPDEIEGACHR